MSWTKFDHDEHKLPSKLTSDPIRQLLAQWPSKMSRTHDHPSPPSLLFLPLPSVPPLSSLHELLKPSIPWEKSKNDVCDDYFWPNQRVLFLREGPTKAVDPVLSRDHRRHKWRLQKKWTFFLGCQDAQDKPADAVSAYIQVKVEDAPHRHCWKFRSQNVQIFGQVNRKTNGHKHGSPWKTQSFLLNGICTVVL